MQKLISDDLINKYLIKEVKINNIKYEVAMHYSKEIITDSHTVIVGFREMATGKIIKTGKLSVPSVREDGMLQKNKIIWFPVNMVIPPLNFYYDNTNIDIKLRYGYDNSKISKRKMAGILNNKYNASSMDDFLPNVIRNTPNFKSILYKELEFEPVNIDDHSKWLVIDLATAIIEMVNMKIVNDITRSQRPGFKRLGATISATHTLIKAFMGHFNSQSEEGITYYNNDNNMNELVPHVKFEDRTGVLFLHDIVKGCNLKRYTPFDFCTGSANLPLRTARLKDGIEIISNRITGHIKFPYTKYRRGIVGILNDDPRRVVVSRAITNSMQLISPDSPHVVTETILPIDSISLPGIRMTHPLNYEDGIIVSKTFAEKAGAFKSSVTKTMIPTVMNCIVTKIPYDSSDFEAAAQDYTKLQKSQIIMPEDTILITYYKDVDGNIVEKKIKSKNKTPAILKYIDKYKTATDLKDQCITYKFIMVSFLPLKIGDKIADAHGNKGTISQIVEDDKMPVWNNGIESFIMHYIAPPEIMKRLALGGEIEDKLGLVGLMNDMTTTVDSNNQLTMDETDAFLEENNISYFGDMVYDNKNYTNMPISTRRMFRLDKNAEEIVTVKSGVSIKDNKRISKNTKLGLDTIIFATKGGSNLVNHLISQSKSKDIINNRLMPIVHGLRTTIPYGAKTYKITEKLPTEWLGKSITEEDIKDNILENTACDKKAESHYGLIHHGSLVRVVVPPHSRFNNTSPGLYSPSKIATAANRIIAEVISIKRVGLQFTNPKQKVAMYKETLSNMLNGKKGIIQNALMPIFPYSINAVGSAWVTEDPLTIFIPKKAWNKVRKNKNVKDFYDKNGGYCLLKRDPVHWDRSILYVKFKIWDENTIGIHPLLVPSLSGDFDGDTYTTMFVTSHIAHADIEKMELKFEDIYDPQKRIKGVSSKLAVDTLNNEIGTVSTFDNPAKFDTLRNKELFNILRNSSNIMDIHEETIKAAKDFVTIKDGTAKTGALSLRFIYSRKSKELLSLHNSMNLYHILAQNTLDAKSGIPVPSLDLVKYFSMGNVNNMDTPLKLLNYNNKGCISEFKEFCNNVQKNEKKPSKMMSYLRKNNPVLACMQFDSGIEETMSLVEAIHKKELDGGFWESLLGYNLGITKDSIFDIDINLKELKEDMLNK